MESTNDSTGGIDAQLARWSETLASIARTGLAFTQNLYERERYEEVLHVAADIKSVLEEATELRRERDHYVQEDRKSTRLNSSHVSESRMPSSA